jgi:predicted metal-dependent hydrolase
MSDWIDEFEKLRRELMEEVENLINLRWKEREKATEDLPSIFDDEIWVTLVEGVEGRLKKALYSVRTYLWEAAGPLGKAALEILTEHVLRGNLPLGYKIGLISVIQKAIELSIFLYKWQRGDLLQLKGRKGVPEEVKREIDEIIRLIDSQVRELELTSEELPMVKETLKREGYASIAATLLESYLSLPEEEREATERRVQRFYEEQEGKAFVDRLLQRYRKQMDRFKDVGAMMQKYQELVKELMEALDKVPEAAGLKERITQVLNSQYEFIWEASGELYNVLEEIEGDSEDIVNVKRKLAELIIFLLEDAKTDLSIVKEKLAPPEDEKIAEMFDETIKFVDYNISGVRAKLASLTSGGTLLRKHMVLGFVLS